MSTFASVCAPCRGIWRLDGSEKACLARRRWSMYHQPFVHGRYPHKPNANRGVETFSSSAIEDDRIVFESASPRLPEITYTILLRPRRRRHLAHRILFKCVPSDVTIQGLKLYLNPNDPVLSLSVAFGIYENYEREVFRQFCKPGSTVVDVGANVGLYTVIAASRVGEEGKVIAIEPHPESYRYLQKTIEANRLSRVKTFNVALGDRRKKIDLFLTEENKADSRISVSRIAKVIETGVRGRQSRPTLAANR